MAIIWKVASVCLGLFLKLCNGFPIGLENSAADYHTQFLTGLVGVLLTVCSIVFLAGCLCCQRRSGFKEFRNQPVAASTASNLDHGHVNPIANGEFTIFTPLSPPHHNNNIFLANEQFVGHAAVDCNNDNIDVRSWFDGSETDFPRTKLKYIRELGKGWFGRVVEGTAQGLSSDEQSWSPVVVRILESSATSTERAVFLHDAAVYKCRGSHPNILKLLGRSLETVPLLILQEFCPQGDLKKYLKENRTSAEKLLSSDYPLLWCCQIASAVKYLHDHKTTHPDLATRNCLLAFDLSLKLGDYGLAADHYPEDYYQGVPAIPVRWCSPESLSYTSTTLQPKQVTFESNIWSLGVTMWEIYECGAKPYCDLSDDEVISHVLGSTNIRLARPTLPVFYTDYIFRLMQSCWTTSQSRPNISQIELMLADLLQVYKNTKDIAHMKATIAIPDFEQRWDNFKPNYVGKTDNEEFSGDRLRKSDEQFLNKKMLSASLNNLHGSLENLVNDTTHMESWLENVATKTGDMSYVHGLSEAMKDLDNTLALENVSSSDSSHQPSPAPESVVKNKIEFKLGSNFDSQQNDSMTDSILYNVHQTSSESETEDEVWRKKIERGAWSEKVHQKSKSVTDLMVLTHIDCSESDSETPLPSLDYRFNYKNVRYAPKQNLENSSFLFGSEGNLLSIHDTFQEELKRMQEERRDSLLFVPENVSQIHEKPEKAELENVYSSYIKDRPESYENTSATTPVSLHSSPSKSLIEELSSPSEIQPSAQVFNVFNVTLNSNFTPVHTRTSNLENISKSVNICNSKCDSEYLKNSEEEFVLDSKSGVNMPETVLVEVPKSEAVPRSYEEIEYSMNNYNLVKVSKILNHFGDVKVKVPRSNEEIVLENHLDELPTWEDEPNRDIQVIAIAQEVPKISEETVLSRKDYHLVEPTVMQVPKSENLLVQAEPNVSKRNEEIVHGIHENHLDKIQTWQKIEQKVLKINEEIVPSAEENNLAENDPKVPKGNEAILRGIDENHLDETPTLVDIQERENQIVESEQNIPTVNEEIVTLIHENYVVDSNYEVQKNDDEIVPGIVQNTLVEIPRYENQVVEIEQKVPSHNEETVLSTNQNHIIKSTVGQIPNSDVNHMLEIEQTVHSSAIDINDSNFVKTIPKSEYNLLTHECNVPKVEKNYGFSVNLGETEINSVHCILNGFENNHLIQEDRDVRTFQNYGEGDGFFTLISQEKETNSIETSWEVPKLENNSIDISGMPELENCSKKNDEISTGQDNGVNFGELNTLVPKIEYEVRTVVGSSAQLSANEGTENNFVENLGKKLFEVEQNVPTFETDTIENVEQLSRATKINLTEQTCCEVPKIESYDRKYISVSEESKHLVGIEVEGPKLENHSKLSELDRCFDKSNFDLQKIESSVFEIIRNHKESNNLVEIESGVPKPEIYSEGSVAHRMDNFINHTSIREVPLDVSNHNKIDNLENSKNLLNGEQQISNEIELDATKNDLVENCDSPDLQKSESQTYQLEISANLVEIPIEKATIENFLSNKRKSLGHTEKISNSIEPRINQLLSEKTEINATKFELQDLHETDEKIGTNNRDLRKLENVNKFDNKNLQDFVDNAKVNEDIAFSKEVRYLVPKLSEIIQTNDDLMDYIIKKYDGDEGTPDLLEENVRNHEQTSDSKLLVKNELNNNETENLAERSNIKLTQQFLNGEIRATTPPKVQFDLGSNQKEILPNIMTHPQLMSSTPFASKDTKNKLNASDDKEFLEFSSNFVDNPEELKFSLETWGNFLGDACQLQQAYQEQDMFDDFSSQPQSLLFINSLEASPGNDDLQIVDCVNPVLIEKYHEGENDLKAGFASDNQLLNVNNVENSTPNDDLKNENGNKTYDVMEDSTVCPNASFTVTSENLNTTYTKDDGDPTNCTGSWEAGEGWFLHPQTSSDVSGQMELACRDGSDSYVGFSMDDEIMAAIRNELLTKLPGAQGPSNADQVRDTDEWNTEERSEVLIKYNVYNTPLSPIPEESCSDDCGPHTPQGGDSSDSENSDWPEPYEECNTGFPETETRNAESPATAANNRHTPSQDSCCSNDTLFNLEELICAVGEQEKEVERPNVVLKEEEEVGEELQEQLAEDEVRNGEENGCEKNEIEEETLRNELDEDFDIDEILASIEDEEQMLGLKLAERQGLKQDLVSCFNEIQEASSFSKEDAEFDFEDTGAQSCENLSSDGAVNIEKNGSKGEEENLENERPHLKILLKFLQAEKLNCKSAENYLENALFDQKIKNVKANIEDVKETQVMNGVNVENTCQVPVKSENCNVMIGVEDVNIHLNNEDFQNILNGSDNYFNGSAELFLNERLPCSSEEDHGRNEENSSKADVTFQERNSSFENKKRLLSISEETDAEIEMNCFKYAVKTDTFEREPQFEEVEEDTSELNVTNFEDTVEQGNTADSQDFSVPVGAINIEDIKIDMNKEDTKKTENVRVLDCLNSENSQVTCQESLRRNLQHCANIVNKIKSLQQDASKIVDNEDRKTGQNDENVNDDVPDCLQSEDCGKFFDEIAVDDITIVMNGQEDQQSDLRNEVTKSDLLGNVFRPKTEEIGANNVVFFRELNNDNFVTSENVCDSQMDVLSMLDKKFGHKLVNGLEKLEDLEELHRDSLKLIEDFDSYEKGLCDTKESSASVVAQFLHREREHYKDEVCVPKEESGGRNLEETGRTLYEHSSNYVELDNIFEAMEDCKSLEETCIDLEEICESGVQFDAKVEEDGGHKVEGEIFCGRIEKISKDLNNCINLGNQLEEFEARVCLPSPCHCADDELKEPGSDSDPANASSDESAKNSLQNPPDYVNLRNPEETVESQVKFGIIQDVEVPIYVNEFGGEYEEHYYDKVAGTDEDDGLGAAEDASMYCTLNDIRFTGPADHQLMSTSFSESADLGDEQDWDSGSDTRSSSSGEFIWKEGEHEESVKALRAAPQDMVTPENFEPMGELLEETESDCSGSEEGESPEFVPSAWDKYALPAKSALRSPEKTLEKPDLEKKSKGVWFKKQKYHCVYEYPREPESPIMNSYDLWQPLPTSLAGMSTLDDDFFVSSTTKPFESYSGLSSQFFPGQNIIDNWSDFTKQFNENVTPDSGMEDITPAGESKEFSGQISTQPTRQIQTLKSLAAAVANRSKVSEVRNGKDALGGLRHARNKLKLDLPPSPSAFTSTKTFIIEPEDEVIVNREVPTFTTFGKSRFLVQHVDTPPDDEATDKNVSFEALPYKPIQKQFIQSELDAEEKMKVESVRGEASLLDSADEDSGIESSTLERKKILAAATTT